MLFPGVTFTGDKVSATIASGVTPDVIQSGVGFMDDGSVAIDTAAPAGDIYVQGFRRSAAGAIYGTTSTNDSHATQGVLVNDSGQLVYVDADPDVFVNGNPVHHTGELCVEPVV